MREGRCTHHTPRLLSKAGMHKLCRLSSQRRWKDARDRTRHASEWLAQVGNTGMQQQADLGVQARIKASLQGRLLQSPHEVDIVWQQPRAWWGKRLR